MRRAIRAAAREFASSFSPRGPIVELGARYQPGYRELGDLRPFFPERTYLGCDLKAGPGVDCLGDAERLPLPDAAAGAVLMFEMLEHTSHPERAVAEARRVLRPGGLLAISVPFTYRLHGMPHDYRRPTPRGVHVWLDGFADRLVFTVGPRLKPAFVFAVAAKGPAPGFADAKASFAERITEAFRRTRWRGFASCFKERGRDFFGLLLGRAELGAIFYDPPPPRATDGTPENSFPFTARDETLYCGARDVEARHGRGSTACSMGPRGRPSTRHLPWGAGPTSSSSARPSRARPRSGSSCARIPTCSCPA